MKALSLFLVASLIILFSCGAAFAGPQELTDEQMTDVDVQKGIKNIGGAKANTEEKEILENLATPIPGITQNDNNINIDNDAVEINSLETQQNQQNVQEQFSQQLFQQVIDTE